MTPLHIRALVRWAYLEPEFAAAWAKREGLYWEMLEHMKAVHRKLVGIFYRSR